MFFVFFWQAHSSDDFVNAIMCQTLNSPLRIRDEQDRQDPGAGFVGRVVGNN